MDYDNHPDDEANDLEDGPITTADIEEALAEIVSESEYAIFQDCRVWTFFERELLTLDKGIVVRLASGDEYQLTIVQSGIAKR